MYYESASEEYYLIKHTETETENPPYIPKVSAFVESNIEVVVSRLLEPIGNSQLDKIRSVVFNSLTSNPSFDSTKGVKRAIHLLYNLGQGYIVSHFFGFSDEELRLLPSSDSSLEGKSVSELSLSANTYDLLFREYLKAYLTLPDAKKDLVGLTSDISVFPTACKPLIKLLILLIISTK